MTLPLRRRRLVAIAAITTIAAAAVVALGIGTATREGPPRTGLPPTPSTSDAATGAPAHPEFILDLALPPLDPVPWTAVEWHEVPGPFGRRLEPGHDRIDALVRGGPGLLAWGRASMPGRNQFDDMGAVYLSQDGRTWLTVPLDAGVGPNDGSEIRVVVPGPAGLLAFGGVCCTDEERPALWRSPDGRAWTRLPYPAAIGAANVTSLVASRDRYVAGGQLDGAAVVWTSRDGVAWAPIGGDPRGFGRGGVNDVAVAPEGIVAVGWLEDDKVWDGAIWASADGDAWERLPAEILTGVDDTVLNRIVVRAGGWLVLGWDGSHDERIRCEQAGRVASIGGTAPPPVMTRDFSCGWGHEAHWITADGRNWVEVVPPAGLVPARPGELVEFGSHRVVAGGPGLVALGEEWEVHSSSIFVSEDGRTWQPTDPATQLPSGGPVGLVVVGRSVLAVGSELQVWVGAAR